MWGRPCHSTWVWGSTMADASITTAGTDTIIATITVRARISIIAGIGARITGIAGSAGGAGRLAACPCYPSRTDHRVTTTGAGMTVAYA